MADANAVAIKLPPFWAEQPAVWFLQAEAQFQIRGITTDATKYYHAVSALDQATAGRLVDLLTTPPADNLYESLKTRLTQTFGLGRRENAARLLHMRALGDCKPSELMDEMLALMDGHATCFLFEQLFLEQLPDDVRLQLANADFSDARKVALLADSLCLAKEQRPALLNRVEPTRPPKSDRASATRNADMAGMCFYHARFGSKAKKCTPPCIFTGNDRAGHQ